LRSETLNEIDGHCLPFYRLASSAITSSITDFQSRNFGCRKIAS
jgi:hypothetical protein